MMKRMFTVVVLTIFFFSGCTSTPTRMNGLRLENSGQIKEIKLNGILISHNDKYILDKSFQVPTVPHDKATELLYVEDSKSFTYLPTGPWEFNGGTLFPEFNSSRIVCADKEIMPWREDCDAYSQLKGPFIYIDCKSFSPPKSSLTYHERMSLIKHEETKQKREKAQGESEKSIDDVEYTAGEMAVGYVGVGLLGAYALLSAPFAIVNSGIVELGICDSSEREIWFDHNKFFDTVKEAITNDYGSIDAYVADIRQASMTYNILGDIDKNKREEIEGIIKRWWNLVKKMLPESDSIDSYQISYVPYSLIEIPRKADWSRRPAAIEVRLLRHYTEQSLSVYRQIDFYNNRLKQKYGINITASP